MRVALDEFVLGDGATARVRIESAGRSMLVTFLDANGSALPGSPVELSEDFSESVGPASILGHLAPVRALRIAENAGHSGLLRVFVVYGDSPVRFFQYARSEVTLDLRSAGDELRTDSTPWRLDGGSPYSGTFTSEELRATGMLDGPGTAPEFDPFDTVVRMAHRDDHREAAEMPETAVFTLANEFETLPYAGGGLLGSITWSYTMRWTLAGGRSGGPEVASTAPVWRGPDDAPPRLPDHLPGSWNPRVTGSRR